MIDLSVAKKAGRQLLSVPVETINETIVSIADALEAHTEEILLANKEDMDRMDLSNPMRDRLMLTEARIKGIADDARKVAGLPSPLGRVLSNRVLPNGLEIQKVSVPFGVIGVIYEARPNVSVDVSVLCLKSGSAVVLKGGSDAECSNRAIAAVIREVLEKKGIDANAVTLLPSSREATAELLHARGFVDLLIPRGSSRLINYVRQEATIPVIETGAGVVHCYFDKDGRLDYGRSIVVNAKTRRVSVCNALDCLIIHKDRLSDLGYICLSMKEKNVVIKADEPSFEALCQAGYPSALLQHACEEDFGTEFLDYKMAVKTVGNLDGALEHIRCFGSGHSECIVTESEQSAAIFQRDVDAACVYVNAPTSFTDGAQFGLGAEIGISTQKLHARGPMALEEICTYKWLIRGNGQTRA